MEVRSHRHHAVEEADAAGGGISKCLLVQDEEAAVGVQSVFPRSEHGFEDGHELGDGLAEVGGVEGLDRRVGAGGAGEKGRGRLGQENDCTATELAASKAESQELIESLEDGCQLV